MQLMRSALRGCASISGLPKTILYQHSHSKLPLNKLESEERDPIGKMTQLFSSYSINNVATQEITTSFGAKKPQPAPQPPSPAHVEIEVERRAVGLTLPCFKSDKLVHLNSSAYKWSGSIAHPSERIFSKDGEDDPHGMMESFPQYCMTCERQLILANSSKNLYCSETCRIDDGGSIKDDTNFKSHNNLQLPPMTTSRTNENQTPSFFSTADTRHYRLQAVSRLSPKKISRSTEYQHDSWAE